MSKKGKILFFIFCLAAAVLLVVTAAVASNVPERLIRPDSDGYLVPARALSENLSYPTTVRPPGYPVLAALIYACGGSNTALAFTGILIAAGACGVIGFAARKYTGDSRIAALAVLLTGFNITMIANAPLLLSDTLFFLFAAWQFWWFAGFWRDSGIPALWGCAFTAALGVLIRPINILFIIPLIVLVLVHEKLLFRKKIIASVVAAGIFFAVITPWMFRNYSAGMTFSIDTNTGAMRHQNGAMLMAEVNGTDFESEKKRLLKEESEMIFPDAGSRERWRIAEFRKMVERHPFIYLKQHFDWQILLPDAPTFLENFGMTSANRGTMGVLKKSGILAAVRYYFGENYLMILFALLPLLAITLLLYAGMFGKLVTDAVNFRSNWRELIIFLAFCEYYLFLPGAITAPRYQLPALPFMSTLAACALIGLWDKIRGFRDLKSKN